MLLTRGLLVASLVSLASLVSGCAAETAEATPTTDGDSFDAVTCPSSDADAAAALEAVAAQAELCAREAPALPRTVDVSWNHTLSNVIALESPNHRGRDALYAVGDRQWVLGKFAYGPSDKDLKGEAVDVYVQRGCAGAWEKLAFSRPVLTTEDGEHATVEGVEDTGGRVFAEIPAAQRLGVGHHRVRMVVAGDRSFAEQRIEVLPRGATLFVSDVDGTLTERRPDDPSAACDEESDFPALWRGLSSGQKSQPFVHDGAPTLYRKLASLGYRPMYLTARPEWLAPHTHAFLSEAARGDRRGDLPQGVVHTTLGLTGAMNAAAEDFKKAELKALVDKGFRVVLGFGNRPSDVATYKTYGVPYRFYIENLDTSQRSCSKVTDLPLAPAGVLRKGDWRIRSYGALVPLVEQAASGCR
jgi:hypothetical protein